MCGIVGYVGTSEASQILLNGLSELEYRGYDSAGIAVLQSTEWQRFRAVGKLVNLREKVANFQSKGEVTAIGHTRWATHGKPTEANAHPHSLSHSQVVHNGIIENYKQLRENVTTPFTSQTDTEVIVHLFEHHLAVLGNRPDQTMLAFQKTLHHLEGAFAILLATSLSPGKIFFAKKGSPLQLAFDSNGAYFSSSDSPLIGVCQDAIYFNDGEYGVANALGIEIFDQTGLPVKPNYSKLPASSLAAQKNGYRYFMEKEIHEQSQVLANILLGRLLANDDIEFEEIGNRWLSQFSSVTLCACGTSYHAALAGSYLLERLAKVPAKMEIASEFRYREPVLNEGTLFIVISQSGETADTLEALKLAKMQGLQTLALCNVDNSSIVRHADRAVMLRAGVEKSVASTKAFSAQVLTLWLLALVWGKSKNLLGDDKLAIEVNALRSSVKAVAVPDDLKEKIHRLSKRYLHGHGFFFIGRDLFYPLALEGALKLKEISYMHAEGYPAGEMKHGPIALADAELFTVALLPSHMLFEKMKSNVEELCARDSTVLAISSEQLDMVDDCIQISKSSHPMLEFFEMLVVLQLLSMEISIRLGNDVDMPRNLAKSVTVE
ncbi:glutamine--fructose-6-phosphate transaminase (isomerizing) [Limnobacter sp.]|uniref:glutamine--fructose-6-phosphate transaminase (isomerizing) n=1 Tax=Limnobacter sp. TaxID=2003368 RepID=UPI00391C5DC2